MSRPQINVRVSKSLLEAWEQATAHTNASAIIRRAMRQYIKEQTSRDVADDIGYKSKPHRSGREAN